MTNLPLKLALGLTIGVFAVVGVSAIAFKSPTSNVCKGVSGKSQHIVIKADAPSSNNVQAHLCDTLTFTNQDAITRVIAFGPHEAHVPYDGIAESSINQNQSFTITLNALGYYHWHDHLHDAVAGYFTVTK